MSRLTPLAAVVLLGSLSAAPVPKAAKKSADHYPLALGDKWEYVRNEDATQVWAEEVTGVEAKDGGTVATVRIAPNNGRNAYDTSYKVDKAGWYFNTHGEVSYDPPAMFLKADMQAGDTWESNYQYGGTAYETTVTVGEAEKVTVPAGEYTALPVTIRYNTPARGREYTNWIVPGVGMVKQVVAGRVTQELKSFTPAGK